MARALQCPDCGNRHPLDSVGGGRTFRCHSCRRLLKVPRSLGSDVSPNGTASRGAATDVLDRSAASGPSSSATKVPPSQRGGDAVAEQRRAARSSRGRDGRAGGRHARSSPLPRTARAALWLVAVPAGLLPVLVVGRLTGLLSLDAGADVFIGAGWQRFVPVLVVLPLWSAVTATIAHLTIEGLGRVLRR